MQSACGTPPSLDPAVFGRAGCRGRGGAARSLAQRDQDARHVGLGDEHLTRLRALVAGDDASALQHVDQAPCARVADAQPALDHRDRGGLGLHDDPCRVRQQVILIGREVALGPLQRLGLLGLEQVGVDAEGRMVYTYRKLELYLVEIVLQRRPSLVPATLRAVMARLPDGSIETLGITRGN